MLFTIRFAGQNLKFDPERGKKAEVVDRRFLFLDRYLVPDDFI